MDDDTLSFIMGSTRRQDVLLTLYQRRMTIPQLSNFLDVNPSMLYRTAKELKERGLVSHNNVRRFKVYRTTKKGEEVLKEMGVIK